MILHDKHLAVIGAGNIGRILLKRLSATGVTADHLVVCDSDPARSQAAATEFGVRTAPFNYDRDAIPPDLS